MHPLATSLASGLAAENQRAPSTERMRLRVVAHAGELLQDPHGHTGQSWNHAARLLDAEATRAVLAANPAATVVLVVSDVLYDGVVRHGYEGIDPDGWQPIRVHGKETSARAWVHLSGLAVQPRLPAVLAVPRVGQADLPIPRELPRPPGDFTGRISELASLRELLGVAAPGAVGGDAVVSPSAGPRGHSGRPVVIIAIDGMGGIGKSALAIEAAHLLADHFPDGQLYVNLQGATPGLAPLESLDALSQLLRSLGLDPAAIPTKVEEAAARFRSLAAERRLLILLDNAASVQQVRALLPASSTCGVLITSRQVLATVEGACRVHLDVLPPEEALTLLGRMADPRRLAADPQAAAEVVRLCGHLPLAIRIAGARLAARPNWPIRVLAERLADATSRLEELADDEVAVQASFAVSLHTLQEGPSQVDQAAAAAFGLLSLPTPHAWPRPTHAGPGAGFGLWMPRRH